MAEEDCLLKRLTIPLGNGGSGSCKRNYPPRVNPQDVESIHQSLFSVRLESLVAPLAHALRLVAAYFDHLSIKRWHKLAQAVCNTQLAKWLEDTPESTSSLFAADIAEALDAICARRTDGLITISSRAFHQVLSADSSSVASTHGRHFEPYCVNNKQPLHGTRSRLFGGRGCRSNSHGHGTNHSTNSSSTARDGTSTSG